MKIRTRTITYSAILLALLICLQWAGSQVAEPMTKQLLTGSFVNCVLAVAALTVGLAGGIPLALISPVMAFLLGIAPNIVTVVPIMAGNACFVLLIHWIAGKPAKSGWRQPIAVIAAAVAKFVVLYFLVVQVICDMIAPNLMGKKVGAAVVLVPPMLKKLPAMFTWPQLITALAGGTIAMFIYPVLKQSNKR